MNIFKNPLLEESLRVYFSDQIITDKYIFLTAILTVVTFIGWPGRHFSSYLEYGNIPTVFSIVTYFSIYLLTFMTAGFSIESTGEEKLYSLSDWIKLTPIPIDKVFLGKFEFAVIHTIFLVLLTAPFLTISASASGISLFRLMAIFGVQTLIIFTYRTIGIFLHSLLHTNRLLLNLLLVLILIILILFFAILIPGLSPVATIRTIIQTSSLSIHDLPLLLFYSLISFVCIVLTYIRLKLLDKHSGKEEDR